MTSDRKHLFSALPALLLRLRYILRHNQFTSLWALCQVKTESAQEEKESVLLTIPHAFSNPHQIFLLLLGPQRLARTASALALIVLLLYCEWPSSTLEHIINPNHYF